MSGIIITTGQSAVNGGTRRPWRGVPQAWAGVPGVTYPPAAPAAAPPPRDKWLATAEAAERLGITPAAARSALHAAGVPCRRVQAPGLFWRRREVEALIRRRRREAERLDHIPAGWLSAAGACRRLGVSRSTLQRYIGYGGIRTRRVQLPTANRCIQMLLCEEDVAAMAPIPAARRAAEEARRTWLTRPNNTVD